MAQSTPQLVKNLFDLYQKFLGFKDVFHTDLNQAEVLYACELRYSQLKFTIHKDNQLYFQCSAAYDNGKVSLTDCYHDTVSETTLFKQQFTAFVLDESNTSGHPPYPTEIDVYLNMAERIARQAHHCTAGDNYHPGYFSALIIQPEGVKLEQINHYNSRSLAHKNDYSLRNLEFSIPFQLVTPQKLRFQEECIGAMRIQFSDRSSENNRFCGDRIRAQIDKEKEKFTSSIA